MKSARVGDELEGRLAAKARTLGVSESEVIRMALEEFCEPLADAPVDAMLSLIAEWELEDAGLPEVDVARHASRLFGESLEEEWGRKQRLLRIAESRAQFQTPAAD